jgi:lipoprotein-anchoring transpeptidase ErfK/SrfK
MKRTTIVVLAAATFTNVAAAQATNDSSLRGDDTAPRESAIVPYRPSEVKVIVSVADRRLRVIARGDTVRDAMVSVASGREFNYAGRRWRFATPRGELRVLGKRTDPVWLPPDWHYAEVAHAFDLQLRHLPVTGTSLKDGSRLVVRDSIAGVILPGDSLFHPLPITEHIVFDSTLFIPPTSTRNRRLLGELGKYALDLGNGYLLHGTQDQRSIGIDTTHGCIRLADEDLEWLYQNVPVGATVVIR